MITLYHGALMPIPEPIVTAGRPNLDFGRGFYTTTLREQAEKWAKLVASRHKTPKTPYLNIYQLDYEKVDECFNVMSFDEYDLDWLDFVVDCRQGNPVWTDYDMIEGGVADDRVIDTVEDYQNGIITAQQALGQLRFQKINNQICITNQKIIDNHLVFVESIKLL